MESLLLVLFVFCLGFIFYQDFKYRKINVLLPLILFMVSLYFFKTKTPFPDLIYFFNLFFLLLILMVLMVYMSIKNKRFLNPFTNYFGLGDLLFFVAISPLFLTREYVLFFILSMLFSILLQTILKKVLKEQSVPLAGYSALLLIIIVASDLFLVLPKFTIL